MAKSELSVGLCRLVLSHTPPLPGPTRVTKRARGGVRTSRGLHYKRGALKFYSKWKQACPLGEILPHPARLSAADTTLGNGAGGDSHFWQTQEGCAWRLEALGIAPAGATSSLESRPCSSSPTVISLFRLPLASPRARISSRRLSVLFAGLSRFIPLFAETLSLCLHYAVPG